MAFSGDKNNEDGAIKFKCRLASRNVREGAGGKNAVTRLDT